MLIDAQVFQSTFEGPFELVASVTDDHLRGSVIPHPGSEEDLPCRLRGWSSTTSALGNLGTHSNLIARAQVNHVHDGQVAVPPFDVKEVQSHYLIEGVGARQLSFPMDIWSMLHLAIFASMLLLDVLQDLW